MRKPRIFIASASESLDVADAINSNLDHHAEVTVWKHGFNLSQSTIDDLIRIAESVDFAIFVFTPDDVTTIRDQQKRTVRDNVVFELGLFSGTLGKERCFIVKPRNTELHLPTDLLGLNPADYEGERSDKNLEAAVNHPCTLIKRQVEKLSLLTPNIDIPIKERRSVEYKYKIGDVEHQLLAKLLTSYHTAPEGVSLWSVFNELKGVDESLLNIATIKLERLGLIDKRIAIDREYNNEEYFAFSITENGVDYLLENEHLLYKKNQDQLRSQTIPAFPIPDSDHILS
ncbi:TIR domain-containing protein [Photobacterium damselae]|uniref:TIR domain-containing protein n=1 Tax=Photobacterium damselae TaxID=38293 RepID=UPI001EDE3B4F|nr:nucleotide-binding protein [Photobacterium damselae]MCG3824275.1 nucleotide-binding protein [Photobacterium damselae]